MLKKLIRTTLAGLLLACLGLNTAVAEPNFGGGCGGVGNCADDPGELSPSDIAGLKFMREEEKLARDIYLLMEAEHGLLVFTNIARSEQNHMDAMKTLIDKYELDDPVTNEAPATDGSAFTSTVLGDWFDQLKAVGLVSKMEALRVGGEIEETDLRDIQAEIDLTEKADIISTYENLLCGSKNHLRAFVQQVEINGEVYEPVLLTDDELAEIVAPPISRKCGEIKQH